MAPITPEPASNLGAMRSLLELVAIGSFAFAATMLDNLFAFAAQLALSPRDRFAALTVSQSAGVVVLVGLATAVGSSLEAVPLRWVGVLAVAPWALAWRTWHHRRDDVTASLRRGAVTTFLVTVGLGGDNLAVWIPLLRANGVARQLLVDVVFACGQTLFVLLAWSLATHPRVVRWGQRSGPRLVPGLYVILGVVILFECHLL